MDKIPFPRYNKLFCKLGTDCDYILEYDFVETNSFYSVQGISCDCGRPFMSLSAGPCLCRQYVCA